MKKVLIGFVIGFLSMCSLGMGPAQNVQALSTEKIIEDLITSKTGKEYKVKKILYEKNKVNIINYLKRKLKREKEDLYIVVELASGK